MKVPHLHTIAMLLLIVAGLNAGVAAVFDVNIIGELAASTDSMVATGLYVLMGLSAVYMIVDHTGMMDRETA